MSTIATRVASGVAVLTLAFATVASSGPPAAADATRPAAPMSVLPQGGSSARSVDALTIGAAQVSAARVSLDKATKQRKKKSSKGARALAFAKRQLGDRYRYGGTGPNAWDCSGLTRGAWTHAGKRIPRTSQGQARSGKRVSKSKLRKGDLVFFYSGKSHVGIYAGKGRVIHASRPGKPVAYIKIKHMPYAGARRPA